MRSAKLVNVLSKRLINNFMNRTFNSSISHDRYMATAVLSDIGKTDMKSFECQDFKPHTVYDASIFLLPLAPLKIVSVVNPDHVEVAITMPHSLANDGRLEDLIEKIKKGLIASDPV